jgi:hypothetical protein
MLVVKRPIHSIWLFDSLLTYACIKCHTFLFNICAILELCVKTGDPYQYHEQLGTRHTSQCLSFYFAVFFVVSLFRLWRTDCIFFYLDLDFVLINFSSQAKNFFLLVNWTHIVQNCYYDNVRKVS